MTTSNRTPDPLLCTEGGDVCPVCGTGAVPRIDLDDYQLFECPSCGSWSSDSDARGATTSFVPNNYFSNADSDQDKWEVLARRLQWPKDRAYSALDVGCGTGAYLAYLGDRLPDAARLEGIELEPERAAESQMRNPNARIHQGDARGVLSQVGQPFDLITLWDVFEHVRSPRALLIELAEVLSDEGVIYLQTIHEHSILPALGRWAYKLSGGRIRYPARRTHEAHHLVFFTRVALDTMAAEAGLRVREVWFDRLARSRMDGSPLVTGATSLLLALENGFGNGLFINLILEKNRDR